MRVLVVDSTPQSLDYHLLAVDGESAETLVQGRLTQIGTDSADHRYHCPARGSGEGVTRAANHHEAFERLASVLASPTTGSKDYNQGLAALTHRIPHGGDDHEGLVPLTSELVAELARRPFGPASGNGGALAGLQAASDVFGGVPQIGVFDTMAACNVPMLYAIPAELQARFALRRFCPHSVSHGQALALVHGAPMLFPTQDRVITLHIAEETSAAAFFQGELVDSSGGLNLYSGLPGATASGTVDSGAVTFLLRQPGFDLKRLERLLAYESGILGMSGFSANIGAVIDEAERGDVRCSQAVDVYAACITRTIGALTAALGGLDVLVLAGKGAIECGRLRELICGRLGFLGLTLDTFANDNVRRRGEGIRLSARSSKVALGLCFSDEAQFIAQQSAAMVSSANSE
jgi:acetate kinase